MGQQTDSRRRICEYRTATFLSPEASKMQEALQYLDHEYYRSAQLLILHAGLEHRSSDSATDTPVVLGSKLAPIFSIFSPVSANLPL